MKNPLIFGKDNTENIVSIEIDNNILYLFKEINGKIEQEVRENKFWVVSNRQLLKSSQLDGNSHYNYIKEIDNKKEFLKYRKAKHCDVWSIYDNKESALVKTGITYFKGMKVNDVSVLSFDIESTGLSQNDTSKVLIISNTFRKNGIIIKKLFCYDEYNSDKEFFNDWCKWVREVDPSIICGHNIFSYDLPYLNYCARNAGTYIKLGRDNSKIKFNPYTSEFRKDGSQKYDYYNAYIYGREIIDTMFLSLKYDIVNKKYESYKLKTIIKQEGLEKEDRQHYDAAKIKDNYTDPVEWVKIKDYCRDDSDDSLALFDLMIPSYFYLTQSIPRTLQQIVNTASGGQLNSFMVRAYLQDNHSLPKASNPEKYEGAISMGIPGIYENVGKIDIASLYPSIMREYKIYDKIKDPKGYLLKATHYFTEQRLKDKELAKQTGDKYYKDIEQAMKICVNSIYGFLGAPGLLFNSPKNASLVTRKGREILLKGVEWSTGYTLKHVPKDIKKPNEEQIWVLGDKVCEGKNFTLVNTDTDSFSYTDGKPRTKDQFNKEIEEINSLYPKMIRWEDDGFYDKFIVVKAKNYVLKKNKDWCKSDELVNGESKVKYKGSAFKSSNKEIALSELLKEIINDLLDGNNNIEEIYTRYIKEAYNIQDINRWTVKKTITKPVLTPERTNELKINNALKNEIISEGDKVWLYSAIDGEVQEVKKGVPVIYKKTGLPKMIPNRILKLPNEWNNDEDKMHYVERVYKTTMILSNVIDESKIIKYHLKKNQNLLDKL